MKIIDADRSVIPACDVPFDVFETILEATYNVDGIHAYKVGVSFLDVGLINVVNLVREYDKKKIIIYDHQKAGTDIHESTPNAFMDAMVRSGIDAVIIFPESGPVTEYEWIRAAQDKDLGVIVGGEMTHPRYLDGDFREGKKNYTEIFKELGIDRPLSGFIKNDAPDDIYEIAARMGVNNFVMPGNKPEKITYYRQLVECCGASGSTVYSPGLIAQNGTVKEAGKAAGDLFHAIVGRGINNPNKAEDVTTVTTEEMHESAKIIVGALK